MFSQGLLINFEIVGLFQLIYFYGFLDQLQFIRLHQKVILWHYSSKFYKKTKIIILISGLGTIFAGQTTLKKSIFLFIYKSILKILYFRLNYTIIFKSR